jgi:hypothetical protein
MSTSQAAKDAHDTRWLRGPHTRLHVEHNAPMPGSCPICRVFGRLKEVKRENKRLRIEIHSLGNKLEKLAQKAEDISYLGEGTPR